MIKGKTDTGFTFKIDEVVFDDWSVVKMLAKVEESPLLVIDLMNKILGEEQFAKMEDHLRGEDGVVKASDMMVQFQNIFESIAALKK